MKQGFSQILERRIDQTSFIDVHEHLVEERTRLLLAGEHIEVPCADASLLFWDYAVDDLAVAGMPAAARERFFSPGVDPHAKWELVAPYWAKCRNTGALRAVRITGEALFAEVGLDAESFRRISETIASWQAGFYADVLATAGIESCQVNSLEAIFCETEHPELLAQDICISWLSHRPDLDDLARQTGIVARDLDGMHEVIDWFFGRFGSQAVAVKSLGAYSRRLDYAPVPAEIAAPVFDRYAAGAALSAKDDKLLQDHLMHYCIGQAGRHRLPVKLHCGYYGGHDLMPLERVRHNAADLCPLLMAYPHTPFVLMHMGYPYQDEYIALAKHFSNVYVDLSFAWLVSPLAAARFVGEFVLTAPATKLLAFGGDHRIIEPVVGHARMARTGLEHALRQAVDSGMLLPDDALDLVETLMRGNARALFPRLPSPSKHDHPRTHPL
jgi:uncharacterized protein